MSPDTDARALRVLHIDTERTWRGGEQQIAYLLAGLARRGHRSLVVAPPGSAILDRVRAVDAETRAVPMRGEVDPLAVGRLARVIREHRPNVVHMHTAHAHALGVAASILARRGARVVSRRVDFSVGTFSGAVKYRRFVDRYIAITRAVADVLETAGVPRARIDVVHSGIDPSRLEGADRARGRRALGLSENEPVAGSVAHFAWHKGLRHLVAAWPAVVRAVPAARLVLVGDGEERALLERAARAGGSGERILFAGFRNDVPDCLAAFDAFVLPSEMEGLGTSILDALFLGRPVVASAVGGIPEVVENGTTGLLVPPRDPERLAAAIVRVLSDTRTARSLGARGRARVERAFTAEAMVVGNERAYVCAVRDAGERAGATR